MIGKVTIGKSFKGCLLYCLNDKMQVGQETVIKNRAEVLMFNKCFGDQRELIQQFDEVRRLNPKLAKPVMHITLSLAPGEHLSKDKWMEVAEECAKAMGFDHNQYVAIQHKDTGHDHLHIVANRVGFEKHTVSDSNSYKKIAAHCRKMELKYELKQVLSPKRFLSKTQQLLPRQDQRKQLLAFQIRQALKFCRSYQEFEQTMKGRGYKVIKGRGISFVDDKKAKIKGSEVGYSLRTLERIIGQHNTPDLRQAFLNAPTNFLQSTSNNKAGEINSVQHVKEDVTKDLFRILDVVTKPTQINGSPDVGAPDKRLKKKRKRSHHL